MAIRWVLWTDPEGFRWRRGIAEDAPDSQAARGIPGGPPDIRKFASKHAWPPTFTLAVHDGLVDRGLFTTGDLKKAGGAKALTPVINRAGRAGANALANLYDRGPTRPT